MQLSIIICTYNPREDYLRRVLDALKAQTLPKEQLELLLIDNASKEPLAGRWDLSWHPNPRIIREKEPGLTPARLRGVKESNCELLVFVDDDNVLFPDYLAECLQIANAWPVLGAWGGQQFPEFEDGPPAEKWKADFWTSTLKRDVWSNNYDRATVPIGAGVCIRRQVALEYATLAGSDPLRQNLDRKGSGLNSCGDFDMAFVACDLGLGLGRFMRLKLDHLMPANRVSDDYLIRLSEGIGYSETVLVALRGQFPSECRVDQVVDFYKRLRLSRIQRALAVAYKAGRSRAIRELKTVQSKLS